VLRGAPFPKPKRVVAERHSYQIDLMRQSWGPLGPFRLPQIHFRPMIAIHGVTEETMQRIVIIGAGFGGLSAAKGLAGLDVDLTIIDQHSYHGG